MISEMNIAICIYHTQGCLEPSSIIANTKDINYATVIKKENIYNTTEVLLAKHSSLFSSITGSLSIHSGCWKCVGNFTGHKHPKTACHYKDVTKTVI